MHTDMQRTEFPCQFCEGIVILEDATTETMFFKHTLPECQQFCDFTPEEFLQKCLEKVHKIKA